MATVDSPGSQPSSLEAVKAAVSKFASPERPLTVKTDLNQSGSSVYFTPRTSPTRPMEKVSRMFGKFYCNTCKRYWYSANAWKHCFQLCSGCRAPVRPTKLQPLIPRRHFTHRASNGGSAGESAENSSAAESPDSSTLSHPSDSPNKDDEQVNGASPDSADAPTEKADEQVTGPSPDSADSKSSDSADPSTENADEQVNGTSPASANSKPSDSADPSTEKADGQVNNTPRRPRVPTVKYFVRHPKWLCEQCLKHGDCMKRNDSSVPKYRRKPKPTK